MPEKDQRHRKRVVAHASSVRVQGASSLSWETQTRVRCELAARNYCAAVIPTALVLFSAAFLSAGCVSKSKADAQVRIAYLAGQQAAFQQMQQQQNRGPSVTLIGPVQNPLVKWTEGLTLGRAIVVANYTSPTDPKAVVIRRNGQEIPVDPKRLLNGEDVPLESGDVIVLQ